MAELIYDKDGRLLFTKEMKQEYTLLMPQMLPVHFTMLKYILELHDYKVDMLTTTHRGIVDEGLKYVHNDTCYPALLVIGQLIDAVKSGKYDPHKVGLMITQTGGGCRASNYIHLLRKALHRAGYDYIPVVSVNLSGLEKNPGFSLGLKLIRQMAYSMIYGDLIVHMANQCRPYEIIEGETDRRIEKWVNHLTSEFKGKGSFKTKHIRENFNLISDDFASIPVKRVPKVRVGIVGEIYIKYAPLGNNNLEEFLRSEDCETIVPGLTDFIIFKCDNRVVDHEIYGGKFLTYFGAGLLEKYVIKLQRYLIEAVKRHPEFRVPCTFEHLKKLAGDYLGYGNKMGEGWLLTGEMLELIDSNINNIVCTQPFGCLPNHVVGKGMVRKIKDNLPQANIVTIDYDPGATRINQENRIKLMLANARMSHTKSILKHSRIERCVPNTNLN
ncbi:MAG: 2-hydroxyacyl-CoA dehydratase [Oscillospiraceae bacterium]|nr:2-hydroxyacyl-CoA dehydratase [Oscillospiraceae bacterium]MDD4414430.1 2-hydroxyacyl-CoA dehydratase [Oscillospiraceae bacterium]